MPDIDPRILEIIEQSVQLNAPKELTYDQAKLYSQYSRLNRGQPGLTSWTQADHDLLFHISARLIDSGLIEKDARKDNWANTIKRGAEILEWLSQPAINTGRKPFKLLSAGAFQIAGYPAMAAGVLDQVDTTETLAPILIYFFNADFPSLLEAVVKFWGENAELASQAGSLSIIEKWQSASDIPEEDKEPTFLHDVVVAELVRCLGVLASYMRWQTEPRISSVITKLENLSSFTRHYYGLECWLLVELTAQVAKKYIEDSLSEGVQPVANTLSHLGKDALKRYVRRAYESKKSILWPSQKKGIEHLTLGNSFALCTPTGSGKTTVAELGIIQSLFPVNGDDDILNFSEVQPIVLFLVPSRALASEFESKFSKCLRKVNRDIVVTGLYGGTDWGPTDAWLTFNSRTLLICTYEKAEALIRFLGPRFMKRVKAVVIDEAHAIAYSSSADINATLKKGENRSLRLESLGMRLFNYLDPHSSRIIALSAVAADTEKPLASWVTGEHGQSAVTVNYRSTRQLIGKLICKPSRNYEIQFDILDRTTDLRHSIDGDEAPYISNPFAPCPDFANSWRVNRGQPTPEKALNPYLLWAAVNFAARDANGKHPTVLISIMSKVENIASDFLTLLEDEWSNVRFPEYFTQPLSDSSSLFYECLEVCADLCDEDSFEYRLLLKGIVLHHGKLPTKLRNMFTQLVDVGLVNIVLATSTLTEGVNLPFEYILLPSLRRIQSTVPAREFLNLAGRAGRPGTGTEGTTLVLLPPGNNPQKRRYDSLISEILSLTSTNDESPNNSALGNLLAFIKRDWLRINPNGSDDDFQSWLEITAPLTMETPEPIEYDLIESLDTLDNLLLSSIEELEKIQSRDLSLSEIEENLKRVWGRAYASFSTQNESELGGYFIERGKALKETIYPNKNERTRLYYSGLPPRKGVKLLSLYDQIIQHLLTGSSYASWDTGGRLSFLVELVAIFDAVDIFKLPPTGCGNTTWEQLLKWWLCPLESDLEVI